MARGRTRLKVPGHPTLALLLPTPPLFLRPGPSLFPHMRCPWLWPGLLVLALSPTLVCAQATDARPASPGPAFDIWEFEVEGNTLLQAQQVERSLRPHMGPMRDLGAAESARQALERAYQEAGYLTVLVELPEQRVDAGVVRLVVLEAPVERLRVTGARYFSQGFIRARVPALAEGEVPNFNRVQEQLAQLNRQPARQVQPVLRPGQVPGTIEAELKVDDRLPLSGGIEINNRHAADTEPFRLSANLRWDNLFQREHSLALTAITAPQATEQSRVLVANYTVPRDTAGLATAASWLGSLVLSDSLLEPLGAATVVGRGFTVGLRHVQTWFVGDASHTVAVGAEFKDLRERVVAGGDELSTPLRYVPWQLAYTGTWSQAGQQTSFNAVLSVGLAALLKRRIDCPGNIGPVDQFACRRLGADGNFAALQVDLQHERDLPWGRLALRAGGQWAQQPLMGGEQLSLGGSGSVRGYYEGEASADQGLLGSVEWRSPNFATWLGQQGPATGGGAGWLAEARALAFVDAARAQTLQPLPGQAARVPLLGTGLGLRARGAAPGWLGGAWSAELELAWPHKPARLNPERDPRWHGRVGLNF